MHVINARNPHTALPLGIAALHEDGIREESRNGPVLKYPTPVTTVYQRPLERLTFHPWRDANPFFMNVEALWMLAGRDDLAPLTRFVARMKDFSDDGGKTSPGAYGKRWRYHFQIERHEEHDDWYYTHDQLDWAVKRLRANPDDRRVVIQMWDPAVDIERADNGGKDVPCNLTVLPWVSGKMLHLTVINRSNDIIWGLYGANAVQFSTLLEYLAARIGIGIGMLTTMSNNFHGYLETLPERDVEEAPDPYSARTPIYVPPIADLWFEGVSPMTDEKAERIFQEDLAMLFEYPAEETQLKARSGYLRRVTLPLVMAHGHFKSTKGKDRYRGALEILQQVPINSDWRLAAECWIQRRWDAHAMKEGRP